MLVRPWKHCWAGAYKSHSSGGEEQRMATRKMPTKTGGKVDFASIAAIMGGVAEVAGMVVSRIPKKEPSAIGVSLPNLEERVVALEKNWTEQALVVQQLAEQLENVAAAGEKLSQRVTLLLAVSIGALFVSVVALLVALLR